MGQETLTSTPVWLKGENITPDQYDLETNNDFREIYGTRRYAVAKPGSNFHVRMAAWPKAIVEAMKEKGIPVTYVLFPDEGHGFARPENNIAFWAIAEQFLAEHLGGRAEPVGDAIDNSTAQVS